VTVGSILLAVPAVLLGFATSFLLGASLTCLAFWTTRVYSLNDFYFALITLFSGQFVPLPIDAGASSRILSQFLPFQMFKYVPAQIILNRLSPDAILLGLCSRRGLVCDFSAPF